MPVVLHTSKVMGEQPIWLAACFGIKRIVYVLESLAGPNLLLCLRCLLKRCWLGDVCEQNCSSGSKLAFFLCLWGLRGKWCLGADWHAKAHGSYLVFPLCYFICLVGTLTWWILIEKEKSFGGSIFSDGGSINYRIIHGLVAALGNSAGLNNICLYI